MIGCTVEKNSASGIRVTASRLRRVRVAVSESSQRRLDMGPDGWAAAGTGGLRVAVVMRALLSRRGAPVRAARPAASSACCLGSRSPVVVGCVLRLAAVAGERQEHVVEARLAEVERLGGDPLGVERP